MEHFYLKWYSEEVDEDFVVFSVKEDKTHYYYTCLAGFYAAQLYGYNLFFESSTTTEFSDLKSDVSKTILNRKGDFILCMHYGAGELLQSCGHLEALALDLKQNPVPSKGTLEDIYF